MRLPYQSRDTRYKRPFGAVATGQTVEIDFPVPASLGADHVNLVVRGDFSLTVVLAYTRTDGDFAVFSGAFSLPKSGVYFYRFEIVMPDGIMHFVGKDEQGKAISGDWLPEWQLSVYDADYRTPDAFKGGVIYHVFVDRFHRIPDGRTPRFGYLKQWNEDVTIADADGVYRANDFFGGNLQGIRAKLDYFLSLGVTALYLSPVFEAASNHRYDTADYTRIDPLLGTDEDFRALTEEAKAKGISVILDGVFNHTGADSIYFNKFGHYPSLGAYQSVDSPYYNWYSFSHFPDRYACWWGVTVVPSIRRDALSFQDMIAGEGGVIDRWCRLGAAGWRLDVVDELSMPFVKRLRLAAKRNDALLIGEVWEDASTTYRYGERREYFYGKELDGVMNYPFRTAILHYVLEGDARMFADEIMTIVENYPKPALDCSMTLIGTHDTVRILNRLAPIETPATKWERLHYRMPEDAYLESVERVKLAATLQFVLPGIPTIYYGDECGMEGFEDPINRRPYYVGSESLLAYYRRLGALRRQYRDDFCADTEVYADAGVAIIRRGKLTAFVNAGKSGYELDAPMRDLIGGKTVSVVEKGKAVLIRSGEER